MTQDLTRALSAITKSIGLLSQAAQLSLSGDSIGLRAAHNALVEAYTSIDAASDALALAEASALVRERGEGVLAIETYAVRLGLDGKPLPPVRNVRPAPALPEFPPEACPKCAAQTYQDAYADSTGVTVVCKCGWSGKFKALRANPPPYYSAVRDYVRDFPPVRLGQGDYTREWPEREDGL